ncbi:MAG: hypothetical protein IPP88_17700 [Betaproteobacteria bacterium]|nr:hypothetical protein [Betaproteobacteria bacterium]
MQKTQQSLASSQWQRLPGWVRKGLIPVALVALIGGGAYYYYVNYYSVPALDGASKTAAAKAGPADVPAMGGGAHGKGGGGGGRFGAFDPNRVQPVIAVPARVADINLVQTALGTVAALKVATVKARVDGMRHTCDTRIARPPQRVFRIHIACGSKCGKPSRLGLSDEDRHFFAGGSHSIDQS